MQDEYEQIPLRLPPPIVVRVIKGETRERERRFTQSFLIGRLSDCQLQIDDSCVSRVHTQVFFDGERWSLRDLESANGTFLDGTRIQRLSFLFRLRGHDKSPARTLRFPLRLLL
jgi:pSer/pThr/pTyr-binding forkhead associated (FHA) protein